VTAVQLPLTSLADDADTVKREIARESGPVVLVGHSYGGAVISDLKPSMDRNRRLTRRRSCSERSLP
jgi:predicted alpha/beta hydrolase family esterase